jgi:hypothetical protein
MATPTQPPALAPAALLARRANGSQPWHPSGYYRAARRWQARSGLAWWLAPIPAGCQRPAKAPGCPA